MKFLKRLTWKTTEERFNPLMYPFLFATFIYGFGFVFLNDWSGVTLSSLFQSMSAIHPMMPILWGAVDLIISILNLLTLLFRIKSIGKTTALVGFMAWIFACIVYAIGGYWMLVLTVTGPYMFFWGWYYLRVADYVYRLEQGWIQNP